MGEKILVTGGGGFLGMAIVKKLQAQGKNVTSISRSAHPALFDLGVSQIQADISNRKAVFDAVEASDAVFHVAAKPGVWGSYESYYKPNVTGTINIVDACKAFGNKRLVYTSSPSVVFHAGDMEGVDESVPYPDRYHAHYPETKAIAERYVRKAAKEGVPVIILRPHLIWGPGDNHLVPRILARAKRLARFGQPGKKVDTIYVDNAADAHLLAMEALAAGNALSGRVYFISQDDPVNIWDMIDRILEAGGQPGIRRRVPFRVVRLAGTLLELAWRHLGLSGEPPMTRFVADELATSHWFDIGAAKRDLGYHPQVSTAEGLKRLSEWLDG